VPEKVPSLVIRKYHPKGSSGVRPKPTGDECGFEAFFRAVFPKAVAVARKVTGEQAAAEDAAIEALAKAHLRWQRIGPAPWREGWVIRVAVNEAIRRLPRATPCVGSDVASDNAWTGDPAEEIAQRQALIAALQRLPRRQREVVVVRYLVGLSEIQVAEMLGISHGTVKTHLHRITSCTISPAAGARRGRPETSVPLRPAWAAAIGMVASSPFR
jgi:RNA polymerase sigma factor (sigma-70 family)